MFFLSSVLYTVCSCACKRCKEKIAPRGAPLSYRKHCASKASSGVPDITPRHHHHTTNNNIFLVCVARKN